MDKRSEMLANEKIGKLLMKLSAPATVGMMVQALYNVVDTIFVGRGVGTFAIGGITVAFPIQMIVMAIAQMIGIGGASIISRSLGSKELEKAEHTTGNIITMVITLSAIVSVTGLMFLTPMLRAFGATDELLPYAVEYMQVILCGTIFFSSAMALNNVIRAEGNARVAMITMLISGGLNIVLDPIFIYGLKMGVGGAALATVIAQATTVLYLIYYFLSGKSTLKVGVHHLKLKLELVREMLAIGSVAFVRQVASSLMAMVLNNALVIYGGDMASIAISTYGVINRVMMFIFMPMFGIVQGFQPIAGFNYGAKKYSRVKEVILLAMKITTIFCFVGFLIVLIIPQFILKIFTPDLQVIELGTSAMRIIILGLPVVGFQIIGSSVYQAFGKARPSLILTMTRQILILIPLVLILPQYLGLQGIWMAFPISDVASAVITAIFILNEMKSLNDNVEYR